MRKNKLFLKKVLSVQEEYKKHHLHDGVSDSYIYRVHIKDVYYISYGTFKRYLDMNARKFLAEMNNNN